MVAIGESIEVDIVDLAAGGDAVGKAADGRTVFVPAAAPGEKVRVRVDQQKKQWLRATLIEIVGASPSRVEPGCLQFPGCGGCSWRHLNYARQLAAKEQILRNALRHQVVPAFEIVAAAAKDGWRRRCRWHFGGGKVGFLARRGRRIVSGECAQIAPPLAQLRERLAEIATQFPRQQGEISATLGIDGVIGIALNGRFSRPCARAIKSIEGIQLAAVEVDPGLWVAADGFAQGSTSGNAAIRGAVKNLLPPLSSLSVVELFAGNGNLTEIIAAARPAQLAAVDEIAPPKPPPHFVRAEALAFLEQCKQADLVVLDPPRSGAKSLVASLQRLAPRHIIYVSCDAQTFARDVSLLGYTVDSLTLIDTMPQTAHFEIVAGLSAD